MIDNYLLEELVAFAKYNTLAQTAEYLNVSQPAITRGTKKIEEELGLKLFKRTPNKISLNETGKFAAKKAARVLAMNNNFVSEVQSYDRNQKQITVASIAPGPLIVLNYLSPKKRNLKINNDVISDKNIKKLLLEEQYSIIFTNYELHHKKITSSYLGYESLRINLNEFTPLASQTKVKFFQLKGMSFIVMHDIEIWRNLIKNKISDAKFLYQNDRETFDEIKNYSIFPYFTTNLSKIDPTWEESDMIDRIPVPISDKEASVSFYVNYLSKNKKRVMPLIQNIQDVWAKAD